MQNLSWVFKKCANKQMSITRVFFQRGNFKFGFRKGFSDEQCLITLLENPTVALRMETILRLFFLISDYFLQDLIIAKLHAFGFRMETNLCMTI